MNITDGFDNEKWEMLRQKLEAFSRSRLWNLRRADRDPDDAVNSAFRTFWDRLQNSSIREKNRRDPVPESEADVLRLLFKHLRRKIHASYREEKTLKRSALRSGDVSAEAANVFFDHFVATGDMSEANLELFFKAALAPIADFPEELRELGTLILQGYTPKEIAEITDMTIMQVYPAIAKFRERVESLEREFE